MPPATNIGALALNGVPAVVGVASRTETLVGVARASPPCDIVEIRADLLGDAASAWLRETPPPVRERTPLLLTIRSTAEGGRWEGTDEERAARYAELCPYVAAVDVELESPVFDAVARAAHAAGRRVIGSFHDFAATPAEGRLRALVEQGVAAGADIVKIAAWTAEDSDVARLEKILHGEWACPLAVMGMGPQGAASRLRLAAEGSCLVYGFLDESSAPGQLSSAELIQRLAETLPHYRAARGRGTAD
ncbi:MAG TPA: type I 3-dehydroquinate dehydratase [Kiritimatiellia bacterium]|nr:type I 3-dehydroquinate dehydratase [Kiritimatiellia bacterium]